MVSCCATETSLAYGRPEASLNGPASLVLDLSGRGTFGRLLKAPGTCLLTSRRDIHNSKSRCTSSQRLSRMCHVLGLPTSRSFWCYDRMKYFVRSLSLRSDRYLLDQDRHGGRSLGSPSLLKPPSTCIFSCRNSSDYGHC